MSIISGQKKIVTVHLIVKNGEKYIRHCLNSVKNQTFKNFEIIVFDNFSQDKTKEIVTKEYPELKLFESEKNFGAWPGFSRSLILSESKYEIFLSVDVIWDENFLLEIVKVMDASPEIGAAQGKMLQWYLDNKNKEVKTNIIDSLGFSIFKSRRLINRSHGEKDENQYNENGEEIFAAEGACTVFRRDAIEQSRICKYKYEFNGKKYCELADEDFFWYSDDIDLTWRMHLLGWKNYLIPKAVMWHDRSTTKGVKKTWIDYFKRLKLRRQIPIQKRRLDWRNTRFAIIKNDFWINILKDLPYVLKREILVLGYTILFEPQVLLEIPKLLNLFPKMLKKRSEIMKKVRVKPKEIKKWFV